MDALRARAYPDILLGMDSRPPGSRPDGTRQPQDPAQPQDRVLAPPPGGPLAGMIPPGFAGRVMLTIPLGDPDRAGRIGPASSAGSGPSTRIP